jgi:hypothetical protein
LPSPSRRANQPTEVQQARQRVADKVLAEIAGDWRFVVKHGRTKKGAWWYRADKVWLQDRPEITVINKIRSACRDVSYDITLAGGSAALAREISSWATVQSVLRLAEQQCMARAEDMPPGLGFAAPLTRTKRN